MIFLISFIVFAFILSAMAVGVIAGRAPIKGSCGGIGALGIDCVAVILSVAKQRRGTTLRQVAPRLGPATRPIRVRLFSILLSGRTLAI